MGIADYGQSPPHRAFDVVTAWWKEADDAVLEIGAGRAVDETLTDDERSAYRELMEGIELSHRYLGTQPGVSEVAVSEQDILPSDWEDVATLGEARARLSLTRDRLEALQKRLAFRLGNSTPLTVYPADRVREVLAEYF